MTGTTPDHGQLHHVELWVEDLEASSASLGWLLEELGYTREQAWEHGRSWRLDPTYVVVEQSPAMSVSSYDRMRPGLNHLAFHVDTRDRMDRLVAAATRRGWRLMYADQHPYAGGPDHCAAFLEDDQGFEVELVTMRGGTPRN